MNKTLKFEIVTGIQPGYEGLKADMTDYNNVVGCIWQRIAKEQFDKSGIYVSAVIKRSKTVYREESGCPKGGERTVVITGVADREIVNDIIIWKNIIKSLAAELKEELRQEVVSCEFMEIEFYKL